MSQVLKLGKNCWAYERANRLSFLIDAASYYYALSKAIQSAKRSIYITGWDIRTYTLIRNKNDPHHGIKLIDLLNKTLEENQDLQVYVLCWNWTTIFSFDRELFARFKWKFKGHRRLHFKVDSNHPLGGSHHQKIVVIDECLGFCGGLDLTEERWDTPDHDPNSPYRVANSGKHYRPHHDVQVAVDGPAAKALSKIFRHRWLNCTGQLIGVHAQIQHDPWPDYLGPDAEDVMVGVSRTIPQQAYEIKTLLIDAISAAKDYIYIENQYFSWLGVLGLLEAKLLDPNGPEIVIVLPKGYTGRLENLAIAKLTAQNIERLRRLDRYGRLRVCYPKVPGLPDQVEEYSVKVHSKVLIVDGKFAKVGSSNFSNRSMSVDTECDLSIECPGGGQVQATIESLLFRLLAEHFSCHIDIVRSEFDRKHSLAATISELASDRARRLEEIRFPKRHFRKAPACALKLVDPSVSWSYMWQRKLWTRGLPRYIDPSEEKGQP